MPEGFPTPTEKDIKAWIEAHPFNLSLFQEWVRFMALHHLMFGCHYPMHLVVQGFKEQKHPPEISEVQATYDAKRFINGYRAKLKA